MTKNTGTGAPAVNSVYSLCLIDTLSYQSTLREKNALFLIFACFVCFLPQNQFQCISWHAENTNRVIFSSYHVEMTHLNCKAVGQRFFTVSGTLLITWRQSKEILSSAHPSHPKTECVLSLFCKFERFIRFDTSGNAPLQRLCQNMVRTWYFQKAHCNFYCGLLPASNRRFVKVSRIHSQKNTRATKRLIQYRTRERESEREGERENFEKSAKTSWEKRKDRISFEQSHATKPE